MRDGCAIHRVPGDARPVAADRVGVLRQRAGQQRREYKRLLWVDLHVDRHPLFRCVGTGRLLPQTGELILIRVLRQALSSAADNPASEQKRPTDNFHEPFRRPIAPPSEVITVAECTSERQRHATCGRHDNCRCHGQDQHDRKRYAADRIPHRTPQHPRPPQFRVARLLQKLCAFQPRSRLRGGLGSSHHWREVRNHRPGMPVFSPHDLRHRRISLLHRQGRSWAEIARFVGQSKLSLTADTYTHVISDGRELDFAAVLR